MALEQKGRSDKFGNRYETQYVIYQLLHIIQGRIEYLICEPIGDEEKGVDLVIGNLNGSKDYQQCKVRNGSQEAWNFSTANSHSIFSDWLKHLSGNQSCTVSLVSPLPFTLLADITTRAKNTNRNPDDFINSQINQSGSETKKLFGQINNVFQLNLEVAADKYRAVDYYSRMAVKQVPDTSLKDNILDIIDAQFITDSETVFGLFCDLLLSENIYGKKIDEQYLIDYLDGKAIFSDLRRDESIPRIISEINGTYHNYYQAFKNGLIPRLESEKCIDLISQGKSIILHGIAGVGKSGCTENIIHTCKTEKIPYLAIKLDIYEPSISTKEWANELGLPKSISYCLDSISNDKNAVLILDQLDSLRWSNKKSGRSINTCMNLIREINAINQGREKKISVVFVCRTYDLENDNQIKSLFRNSDESLAWEEIKVDYLSEEEVQKLAGYEYSNMNKSLKDLLRTPSNLYVWQHLDSKNNSAIGTKNQLIEKWWKQVIEHAIHSQIAENDLESYRNKIVDECEKRNARYVSKWGLGNQTCENYLLSCGFIIGEGKKIGFVHQSILDYYLAQKMVMNFDGGLTVEELLGKKEDQRPITRYRFQMFLELLSEYDSRAFVQACDQAIQAEDIRFNIKYVVFEVLKQILQPSTYILQYVKKLLSEPKWESFIINSVLRGHAEFTKYIADQGILSEWINNGKEDIVIQLLSATDWDSNSSCIDILKKYAFTSCANKGWRFCFSDDYEKYSDELFDVYLRYFKEHINDYMHSCKYLEKMQFAEKRAIRLFEAQLNHAINLKGRHYDTYHLVPKETDIKVHDYRFILDTLLPYMPANIPIYETYWYARIIDDEHIERGAVHIIKKAAQKFAQSEPDDYFEYFTPYMGKGYSLINEIILDSMFYLPESAADRVIDYLSADLEKNAFEKTSEEENELFYTKRLLKKFSPVCSKRSFELLDNKICTYVPSDIVRKYKDRYEIRKTSGIYVIWSVWGDLQYELLPCLPSERCSAQSSELLSELKRKDKNGFTKYRKGSSHFGTVKSPVAGKNINIQNWYNILTNSKVFETDKHEYKGDAFVESTPLEFANDFMSFVRQNPIDTLKYLSTHKPINQYYVMYLYIGLNDNSNLDNPEFWPLFKKICQIYHYNYHDNNALYFCQIVQHSGGSKQNGWILDKLIDIVKNHENHRNSDLDLYRSDKDNLQGLLQTGALNNPRSAGIMAMAKLVQSNPDLHNYFKDTIAILIDDISPYVRFSLLDYLIYSYKSDNVWSSQQMIKILINDSRLCAYRYSRWIFINLYPSWKKEIDEMIEYCVNSNDPRLLEIGGLTIGELYFKYGAYSESIIPRLIYKREVHKGILRMTVNYYNINEYSEKAKSILMSFLKQQFLLSETIIWGETLTSYSSNNRDLLEGILNNVNGYNIDKKVLKLIEDNNLFLQFKYQLFDWAKRIIDSTDDINHEYAWDGSVFNCIVKLYEYSSDSKDDRDYETAQACLDIWDLMYKRKPEFAVNVTNGMLA